MKNAKFYLKIFDFYGVSDTYLKTLFHTASSFRVLSLKLIIVAKLVMNIIFENIWSNSEK